MFIFTLDDIIGVICLGVVIIAVLYILIRIGIHNLIEKFHKYFGNKNKKL